MQNRNRISTVLAVLLAVASAAVAGVPSGFLPSGQTGIIVYSQTGALKGAGDLYFIELSDNSLTPRKLTNVKGFSPIISPDGRYVVFTSGSSNFGGTIHICRLEENATAHRLGSGYSPHWWYNPSNSDVYITYTNRTDDNSWGSGNTYKRKVNLSSMSWAAGAVEVKFGGQSSHSDGGFSHSFRYCAEAYRDAVLYDLQSSTRHNSPGDGQKCNPSIAPGTSKEGRMMHLNIDHASWRVFGADGFNKRYAPGGSVQTPEWSTHINYMTYVAADGAGAVVAVKFNDNGIQSKFAVKSGSNTCPHMWVGSRTTTPSLRLSPSSLDFTYVIGESAPANQNVSVSITDGAIQGLAASESASWLSVTTSGNTLVNSINTGGLSSTRDYSTTVTVSADGAQSASYTVSLRVTEPPVLTTITVSPATAFVPPGGTQQFSATANDQFGHPLNPQPPMSWTATGAGTIDGAGLFTAGASEGAATVTASSGSVSGSAEVTVAETPPLHLKLNAGGTAVSDWIAQQYESVGADYTFGGTHDVSSVTDPAPNDVYQTCRHRSPTFDIPAGIVPNGTYTVRLHFTDSRGSLGDRQMNISIEGTNVLSGYDIVASAGGQNIAVIEEFTVTVSDGNGMTIDFDKGNGDDAFVSGIEVIGGSAPKDTVTVLAPSGDESYSVGDAVHVRWQTDESIVSDVEVFLSVDDGENWALLTTRSIAVGDTNWGDFVWVVTETVTTPAGTVPTASNTCRFRVKEYSGEPFAVSALFTIAPNSTTVSGQLGAGRVRAPVFTTMPGHGIHVDMRSFRGTIAVHGIDGRLVARYRATGQAEAVTFPARPGTYVVSWVGPDQRQAHTLCMP
ncbi:MAG: hypothetical protein GF331_00130 [Chitinivibrionales bacterium]|nr:hypothetical protein [Chitinivibrionales bacterium]